MQLTILYFLSRRYFKCYPEHQNAFKPFKDVPLDELRRNKRFQAHCVGIVSTLNEAFNALDDPELMRAYLNVSGERHAKRGQGRKEFDVNYFALLLFRIGIKNKCNNYI